MSMLELTDYAERNLTDQLSTVPASRAVTINGARRYSMRVWLDRQALGARSSTVTDIEDALRRENVELPAGRLEFADAASSRCADGRARNGRGFREPVIARGADGHLVRLARARRR